MISWILKASAVLLLAAFLGLALYECRAVRERQSIPDTISDLTAALPDGSSDDEITQYLEAQDIPHMPHVVSEQDALGGTSFVPSGIKAGTNVIIAYVTQSGTLIWLSARELEIIFVLTAKFTLDRIEVVPYELE